MAKNITITRQFEDKLIKFINSYYNTYYDIDNIDEIRITTAHIHVRINANTCKTYRIFYDKFSEFNY